MARTRIGARLRAMARYLDVVGQFVSVLDQKALDVVLHAPGKVVDAKPRGEGSGYRGSVVGYWVRV